MSKIALGILVGAALGVLDGLTAWFTPEARAGIAGIVAGSTPTIVFGVLVAGLFAYLVARMQGKYYFEIMLPGSLVGLITGYATQRYGRTRAEVPARA